ncbi:hypothetical protein GW17_00039597 [Ensete ventricosum]|nr:hypothetical protein GW17_00039597 [Ensete ventricosum]
MLGQSQVRASSQGSDEVVGTCQETHRKLAEGIGSLLEVRGELAEGIRGLSGVHRELAEVRIGDVERITFSGFPAIVLLVGSGLSTRR